LGIIINFARNNFKFQIKKSSFGLRSNLLSKQNEIRPKKLNKRSGATPTTFCFVKALSSHTYFLTKLRNRDRGRRSIEEDSKAFFEKNENLFGRKDRQRIRRCRTSKLFKSLTKKVRTKEEVNLEDIIKDCFKIKNI
jgi:hypothetical protein